MGIMRIKQTFYGFIMKISLHLVIFLAILFTSNQSLYSQDKPEHPIDIRLKTCFENDSIQSNSSMCDCFYEGRDSWQKLMDKLIKNLDKLLDKSRKADFKKQQALWKEFSTKEQYFYSNLTIEYDGSEQIIDNAGHEYERIKQRALEVQMYVNRIESFSRE
jgi:hypothetical protein